MCASLSTHSALNSQPHSSFLEALQDPRARYLSQLFPAPPVLCGRALRPLSIGRYRLMARFNCAWCADEPRTATAGDLLIGILICSVPCEDFETLAAQPDFKKLVQLFGELHGFFKPTWRSLLARPRMLLALIARWLNPRFYDAQDAAEMLEAMQTFQKYIETDSQSPDYWDESEGGRLSIMHWSQSIELVLMGQLNWTEKMINEKPLGKALWDYFAHMESQGLVTLMSRDEIAEFNRVKNLSPGEQQQQASAMAAIEAAQVAQQQQRGIFDSEESGSHIKP